MKTRAEQIKAGKLWQVYYDKTPDAIMFEGSKTACVKWANENGHRRAIKRGEVRLGNLIWEK